jgi:hypothetical protein
MPDRIIARARQLAVAAAALAAGAVAVPAAASAATPTSPGPLTVLSGGAARGGDIFLTPTDNTAAADGLYANGAEILSPTGQQLWFHQAPAGDVDADFRPQVLDGRRVLTFWEGANFGGLSDGTDYIYNDRFQQIAALHAGPGLTTDGHEFLLTPWGTAFVVSYDTATADLTSIGGPADQTVIDGIVQEIDVHTGRVLWSWNSADHVPYSASEQPLPASASTPWDWFHVNAVHLDTDGNLLIDARDTWAAYKVSLHTGAIIWTLGGKDSNFRLRAAPGQSLNDAGAIFAWQHDPEAIGHDEYTFFDNESAGVANTGVGSTAEFAISRIDTVKLDPRTRTATLVATDNQPENEIASSQGNGQRLPGGGEFVGWGILNSISQFDGTGRLVFNAEFPAGVNTYRAYLDPWGAPEHGHGPGHGDGVGHGHGFGHGPRRGHR